MKHWSEFCICFLLLLFGINAIGNEPENFIPGQSPVVMRVDAQRFLSLPAVSRICEQDENARKVNRDIENIRRFLNIDPKDFLSGDVWCAMVGKEPDQVVFLIKTKMPESDFARIYNMGSQYRSNDVNLSKSRIAEQLIYIASPKKDNPTEVADDAVAFSYLDTDVIVCGALKNFSGQLFELCRQGGKNPLLAQIDRKALLAVQADLSRLQGVQDMAQINQLNGALDLTGTENQDLLIQLKLDCANKEVVQQLSMQLQFLAPSLIGMIFGRDENLAMAMASALKVQPQDKALSMIYRINLKTVEKAVAYLADPANRSGLTEDQDAGLDRSQSAK